MTDGVERLNQAWERISAPACTCTLCNDLPADALAWLNARLRDTLENKQRGGRTSRGVPSIVAACKDAGYKLVTKSRTDAHMTSCVKVRCPAATDE